MTWPASPKNETHEYEKERGNKHMLGSKSEALEIP
jgi:hypothetical protein